MNEDCLNQTDYLLSSQKGGWSYLPLSKPFLVPASFLEHTIPLLCILSAFHLQNGGKVMLFQPPPHLSCLLTTVLLPSWRLCTHLSLCLGHPPPAPLLSQVFELSVSTLEGPFTTSEVVFHETVPGAKNEDCCLDVSEC